MLSSIDIKRQILDSAKNSSIRKKMGETPSGMTEGEQVEIGEKLEAVTKHIGWAIIENFMLDRMNLVNFAINEKVSDVARGVAKGYIELMQYIQLSIKRKNEIIEKERLKYEAKNVSKDEIDEG